MTRRWRVRARLLLLAAVPAALCSAAAVVALFGLRLTGASTTAFGIVAGIVLATLVAAFAAAVHLADGVARPIEALAETLARADPGTRASADGTPQARPTGVGELDTIEQGVRHLLAELDGARSEIANTAEANASRLREQTLLAERASEEKNRLMGSVSHDMRQPLQALGLLLASLRAQIDDTGALDLVDTIEGCVGSVNEMLTAVLTLYRLDAGAMKPDPRVFPIAPLLYKVHLAHTPRAQQKSLSLRVVPTDAYVRGDPLMIESCLASLVSNAIRNTQRGGVVIGCRRGTDRWIRLEVWDSGSGIETDKLGRIFDEFYRIDSNKTGADERGLGLGLAIVKRLAQLMRIKVDVRSWLGRGSVFSLRLPRARAFERERAAARQEAAEASELGGRTILVIDDDERILTAMERLIHVWGGRPITAGSLDRALALLRASPDPPAIVVSDYWLGSGIDGNTAINAVRAEFGASVIGVLLTGDTSIEKERHIDTHGNTLLYKPIRPEELHALLHRLLFSDAPTLG